MKEKRINKILQASYQDQNQASNSLNKIGFTYDNALSTNDSKVFVDKNGNPNIAFRGTHKFRVKDVISDLALFSGLDKYNPRFQETKRITRLVEQKYGKPANVFGDSLGGTLAENSGASGSIYTHNKGVGIGGLFKNIPKNQIDYRNTNDVVSLGALTQNHSYNNLKQKQTNNGIYDVLGNHSIQ